MPVVMSSSSQSPLVVPLISSPSIAHLCAFLPQQDALELVIVDALHPSAHRNVCSCCNADLLAVCVCVERQLPVIAAIHCSIVVVVIAQGVERVDGER